MKLAPIPSLHTWPKGSVLWLLFLQVGIGSFWGCGADGLAHLHLLVYCLAVMYHGVKKRGFILCEWMIICAGRAALCLGSGPLLGCHPRYPGSLDAIVQASILHAFVCMRWCFRSLVTHSFARSPGESSSFVVFRAAVCLWRCSEAQATLWVFAVALDKFLMSHMIWFIPD